MRAAAIMRRPVIFMIGLYRGGNRYHVAFEPLADFSAVEPRQREAAVQAAIERYAAVLEKYVRSDPYNWFNFFDFWRSGNDRVRLRVLLVCVLGLLRPSRPSCMQQRLPRRLGTGRDRCGPRPRHGRPRPTQARPRELRRRRSSSRCSIGRSSPRASSCMTRRTGWKSARSNPNPKASCSRAVSSRRSADGVTTCWI